MFDPSKPRASADAGKTGGRPLTILELGLVLEELDRVVAELQDSLTELALPFDGASHDAARAAICAARRQD